MARPKKEAAPDKVPQQEYETVESTPTPETEIVKADEAGEAESGTPAAEDAIAHPENPPSLDAPVAEGAIDHGSTEAAEEREAALLEAEKNDEGVWEIGKITPETKYLDLDSGEITSEVPVRGQILAVKGTPITASTLKQLGKA